uniref:t-SNARE coiled-coil homology domain-containing protein n=1 Tax=Chromera velia CCMP2878 TaxID=1169474 RepID=A0A0G4FQT4_9ALVE|eukprot:Cvel_18276.t1-p1 / transcript=Cvel_18276.t1 / gene=Cvel_18276 / organism=Chromera_velia_CCMP2878 / gene_product=Vesicle transport v-SNARE 11, putative / transcript_product=Vesicle transport v-SNARE 11, putative / location=Cvel_scaffold1505:42595-44933(-) / protein_length=161 / sequence_SO=supercontig / SO=protein_coding / is_pseudo=false
MEMEVRTLPGKAPELMPRVADHRRALEAVTREVRTRKTEAQRRALLDADGNASAAALEQRQRMKDVEGRIRDGTKQVEEAQRLALETEQIGTGIMTDLHGQRETIQRARANVRVMGSNLDDARRRINNMTSRMLQNKVILYVVSGVLLLVILWILWVKLFG